MGEGGKHWWVSGSRVQAILWELAVTFVAVLVGVLFRDHLAASLAVAIVICLGGIGAIEILRHRSVRVAAATAARKAELQQRAKDADRAARHARIQQARAARCPSNPVGTRHRWRDDRCVFCGAPRPESDR